MKAVILAGGLGTRLAEQTEVVPKPMVEIGGRPIIWHIMKHLSFYGINEFIVALGYKSEVIKRYFLHYAQLNSNCTIDLRTGDVFRQKAATEDWVLHLVDTGANTMTGGRVKRLESVIGNETFLLTYGDGVSDVDIDRLRLFHEDHGRSATVTAVRPPARFGGIVFDGDRVDSFTEKPQIGEGWINGGYFILEPSVIDFIAGDETSWEKEPLEQLTKENELYAYRHEGFWQCMDTIRELRLLEEHWQSGNAPWKVWGDAPCDVPLNGIRRQRELQS